MADYVYNICLGEYREQNPIERPPTWTDEDNVQWEVSEGPAWFSLFNPSATTQGFIFIAPSTGTFTVVLTPTDKSEYTLTIEITVTNCYELSTTCGDYSLNIAWFNRLGGWTSYVFVGDRTLGIDIDGSNTFKQSGVIKYESHEGICDSAKQPSGYISLTHLNLLKELKITIQAYEFNTATDAWDIPILIKVDSFALRQEGNGFYTYDIEYKYATEIEVQGQ